MQDEPSWYKSQTTHRVAVTSHTYTQHTTLPSHYYEAKLLSPVSTSEVDKPSTRPVNSASGNVHPSTRPVLTGNGNRSPVNSGR